MWDHMQGYGLMGFGGFIGLIFWVLLIVAVIAGVKWLVGSPAGKGQGPSAMEILSRRYASGEISEEQYRKMKKDIEGGQ